MVRQLTISGAEKDQKLFIDWVADRLNTVFSSELDQDLFLLAVIEAVNNAVEHGHLDDREKQVKIEYYLATELALVSVTDQGPGFRPVFPDLKNVTGSRGRGLGLIRENTDTVLFNANGNQIILLKGGRVLDINSENKNGISVLPGGLVLVPEFVVADNTKVNDCLCDLFESLNNLGRRSILLDLRKIKLLASREWGTVFAEAENEDVANIILFNSSEAITTSAKQMGLGEREAPYNKIKVYAGLEETLEFIACSLESGV